MEMEMRTTLSGAARKRFKWLIQNGLSADEARIKALEPINKDKGPKRTWSEDSSSEVTLKRQKTDGTGTGQSSSGASLPPGIRVGIFHATDPQDNLVTEQLTKIQEAILDLIVQEPTGSVKPKFLGTTFKSGWLSVNCADKTTADWLIGKVTHLKPWEQANLKAVEEKDLPKTKIVHAYFPNSKLDTTDQILKLVEGQNEGLDTQQWRVLKRSEQGSAVFLTLSIDLAALKTLKQSDWKISFKFGQATIKLKGNKPRKPVAVTVTSASSSSTTYPYRSDVTRSSSEYSYEYEPEFPLSEY